MRRVINRKQIQQTKDYYFNGRPLTFDKDSGYTFSDHPAMDKCVEYFLSLDGFELVGQEKKEVPKQEPKKEKKQSENLNKKNEFTKKTEKKSDFVVKETKADEKTQSKESKKEE